MHFCLALYVFGSIALCVFVRSCEVLCGYVRFSAVFSCGFVWFCVDLLCVVCNCGFLCVLFLVVLFRIGCGFTFCVVLGGIVWLCVFFLGFCLVIFCDFVSCGFLWVFVVFCGSLLFVVFT